jgi:hypothetical protein
VCLRLDMPDMEHRGVTTLATEASAGRYDARLRFSMTGAWKGSIVIAEPDKAAVSVPMQTDVR